MSDSATPTAPAHSILATMAASILAPAIRNKRVGKDTRKLAPVTVAPITTDPAIAAAVLVCTLASKLGKLLLLDAAGIANDACMLAGRQAACKLRDICTDQSMDQATFEQAIAESCIAVAQTFAKSTWDLSAQYTLGTAAQALPIAAQVAAMVFSVDKAKVEAEAKAKQDAKNAADKAKAEAKAKAKASSAKASSATTSALAGKSVAAWKV